MEKNISTRAQIVYSIGFLSIVSLLLLDRWLKWWAVDSLSNQFIVVIPQTLEFALTYNHTLLSLYTFSFEFTIAVVLFALAAVVMLCMRAVQRSIWSATLWSALLIGGALSNLFDRFVYGGVVDMIRIPTWTVFNLADLYILVGAFALAWILPNDIVALRPLAQFWKDRQSQRKR